MNISITISDASVPAWQHRVDQFNDGSGQPAISIVQFIQQSIDDEGLKHSSALKDAQRKEMISIADEILAAPLEKQQAAISAALEKVRS